MDELTQEELEKGLAVLEGYAEDDKQREADWEAAEACWVKQEAYEESLGRTHAALQLLELEQEALDAGYPSVESYLDSMEDAS